MFSTQWHFGLADFEDCKNIRTRVFVDELGYTPEQAFDWFDGIAAHLLVLLEGKPIATARIFPTEDSTRIDSIAVLPEYRGQHYGDLCLRVLLYKAANLTVDTVTAFCPPEITGFLTRMGFTPVGTPRESDGAVFLQVKNDEVNWESPCQREK